MVEQAVQTVPLVSAAQKRGNPLTQPQSKQSVRPAQRSGWEGSQVQKENIPTSKQLQMRLRPLLPPPPKPIFGFTTASLSLDGTLLQTTAAKTEEQVIANQKQKPKQSKKVEVDLDRRSCVSLC